LHQNLALIHLPFKTWAGQIIKLKAKQIKQMPKSMAQLFIHK
jgi:hypothetical protein